MSMCDTSNQTKIHCLCLFLHFQNLFDILGHDRPKIKGYKSQICPKFTCNISNFIIFFSIIQIKILNCYRSYVI